MRWLVIVAACVVALLAFLLGGLTMSSAANASARGDLLTGRAMWAFAAALLALALYVAVTRSPAGLTALTWVVAGTVAALALLFATIFFRSR